MKSVVAPLLWSVRERVSWGSGRARALYLAAIRPFGYLAFAVALGALSAAARILGDGDELGFFAGRLGGMIRRYPEVVRPGAQAVWLTWAVLMGVALSPLDPIASRWDEALLGAFALGVLWRRLAGEHRAGR
jgi:hypothetical protein